MYLYINIIYECIYFASIDVFFINISGRKTVKNYADNIGFISVFNLHIL